jgi:lactate dehydrogenase-like 2-hydroxyacid dehydrogenase
MTTSTLGRILWPSLPAEFHQLSRDAVGPGFDTEFCAKAEEVTDEQWGEADGVVGQCPPQYIDKLRKCRVFVKYGVGYDDVDIERFGKMGIAVCNTPDYGTREVADHAIALMMTLAKNIAYHYSCTFEAVLISLAAGWGGADERSLGRDGAGTVGLVATGCQSADPAFVHAGTSGGLSRSVP